MECAVIGNEEVSSTWPGEILLSEEYGFYTYEAKYVDEKAIEMKIPANLSKDIQQEVRLLSEQAYKALRCSDFARVDLLVSKEGEVFVNEINTIPGFTNASMFPVLWENMDLSYRDLLTKLLNLAFDRWNRENTLEREYLNA